MLNPFPHPGPPLLPPLTHTYMPTLTIPSPGPSSPPTSICPHSPFPHPSPPLLPPLTHTCMPTLTIPSPGPSSPPTPHTYIYAHTHHSLTRALLSSHLYMPTLTIPSPEPSSPPTSHTYMYAHTHHSLTRALLSSHPSHIHVCPHSPFPHPGPPLLPPLTHTCMPTLTIPSPGPSSPPTSHTYMYAHTHHSLTRALLSSHLSHMHICPHSPFPHPGPPLLPPLTHTYMPTLTIPSPGPSSPPTSHTYMYAHTHHSLTRALLSSHLSHIHVCPHSPFPHPGPPLLPPLTHAYMPTLTIPSPGPSSPPTSHTYMYAHTHHSLTRALLSSHLSHIHVCPHSPSLHVCPGTSPTLHVCPHSPSLLPSAAPTQ